MWRSTATARTTTNRTSLSAEDFGQTFRSLRGSLPWGSTRCLREDIQNENLLFCGTEFGLWTSLDRGIHWTKLNNNLPTVAVHEVAIHPTNGEMVAATHGRSLWACDISALRQLSAEHVKEKIALFKPAEVIRWQSEPARGRTNRRFTGTNPAAAHNFGMPCPKRPSASLCELKTSKAAPSASCVARATRV